MKRISFVVDNEDEDWAVEQAATLGDEVRSEDDK